MYSELKQLFGKPTPLRQLMEEELYEAETKLLKAQSGLEWATANVAYETNRVARLKSELNANKPVITLKAAPYHTTKEGYVVPHPPEAAPYHTTKEGYVVPHPPEERTVTAY